MSTFDKTTIYSVQYFFSIPPDYRFEKLSNTRVNDASESGNDLFIININLSHPTQLWKLLTWFGPKFMPNLLGTLSTVSLIDVHNENNTSRNFFLHGLLYIFCLIFKCSKIVLTLPVGFKVRVNAPSPEVTALLKQTRTCRPWNCWEWYWLVMTIIRAWQIKVEQFLIKGQKRTEINYQHVVYIPMEIDL